jgi:integrase
MTDRETPLALSRNIAHDLRLGQDQAGHASPTTTAIYAKTNSKARRRQVEALDGD